MARGVKDNQPYMHDERLLTLEDTVEFFNLILGTKLAPQGEAGSGGVSARALDSVMAAFDSGKGAAATQRRRVDCALSGCKPRLLIGTYYEPIFQLCSPRSLADAAIANDPL